MELLNGLKFVSRPWCDLDVTSYSVGDRLRCNATGRATEADNGGAKSRKGGLPRSSGREQWRKRDRQIPVTFGTPWPGSPTNACVASLPSPARYPRLYPSTSPLQQGVAPRRPTIQLRPKAQGLRGEQN
ncbi:hypothetical protein HNY73_010623 [Argiope bruennichi]|uniref:Uncharacterized protein n=1 Tax=Argiope bruennichi TaxID=94029 RepID=A0A8T0F1P2_ARGBR|nr:hypothetical protein HNY73_010623 [Argiope bruennichi]